MANLSDGPVLLRLKAVMQITGMSRSSIYGRMREGSFPRQVSLSNKRMVCWVKSQVDAWIERQIEQSQNESDTRRISRCPIEIAYRSGKAKRRGCEASDEVVP